MHCKHAYLDLVQSSHQLYLGNKAGSFALILIA